MKYFDGEIVAAIVITIIIVLVIVFYLPALGVS